MEIIQPEPHREKKNEKYRERARSNGEMEIQKAAIRHKK